PGHRGALVGLQPAHRVEDRVMLHRTGHHPDAGRVGGAPRPEDALDRQVVALGAARREDHLRGTRAEGRGHLLARRLHAGPGAAARGIATATACAHFVDLAALERLLGEPVRTGYRRADESRPPADAVIVAPATYNTINKWANGISDTYVLSLLAELTGLGTPI